MRGVNNKVPSRFVWVKLLSIDLFEYSKKRRSDERLFEFNF